LFRDEAVGLSLQKIVQLEDELIEFLGLPFIADETAQPIQFLFFF